MHEKILNIYKKNEINAFKNIIKTKNKENLLSTNKQKMNEMCSRWLTIFFYLNVELVDIVIYKLFYRFDIFLYLKHFQKKNV